MICIFMVIVLIFRWRINVARTKSEIETVMFGWKEKLLSLSLVSSKIICLLAFKSKLWKSLLPTTDKVQENLPSPRVVGNRFMIIDGLAVLILEVKSLYFNLTLYMTFTQIPLRNNELFQLLS